MCTNHTHGNKECKSDEHIKHLCFLLSQGEDEKNPEAFQKLVGEPRFQCHTCGRTARSEENVCMPIEL